MSEPLTSNPITTAASEKLQKFEDCMALIDSVKDDQAPANLHAALKRLRAFFETRIGRQTAKEQQDGSASVKAAISGGRTFKPYAPRPLETPSEPSNAFRA